MPITQDNGIASANAFPWLVRYDRMGEMEPAIRHFLNAQPLSWEGSTSPDYMVEELYAGRLQALLFAENDSGTIYGLCLFRLVVTDVDRKAAQIAFLTCDQFYKTAQVYPMLERSFAELGATHLEAVAHPTIASYAHKHHGWAAPGVYIRKELSFQRMN